MRAKLTLFVRCLTTQQYLESYGSYRRRQLQIGLLLWRWRLLLWPRPRRVHLRMHKNHHHHGPNIRSLAATSEELCRVAPPKYSLHMRDAHAHDRLRVRFQIIGNACIKNVGKSQSCMVSKLPIICVICQGAFVLHADDPGDPYPNNPSFIAGGGGFGKVVANLTLRRPAWIFFEVSCPSATLF